MNSSSESFRRGKINFLFVYKRGCFFKQSVLLLVAYLFTDYGEKESVDEIRQRIHSLRKLVEEEVVGDKQQEDAIKKSSKKRKESMDTGSLLSFTFGTKFSCTIILVDGLY